MPRFDKDDDTALEQKGATYEFSAASLDDLGATEYTLVTLAVDVSGSVGSFKDKLEKAIQAVVESCKLSPRVDNLMLRIITFDNNLDEMHGFKLFSTVNIGDYDDCLSIGGATALYDATFAGLEATGEYGKQLVDADFDANAILVIITDGDNNASVHTAEQVATLQSEIMRQEALESLVTILIGVNMEDSYMSGRLDEFKDKAGLTQFVALDDASPETLAKMADFISRSISSQSQALGTGGPSQSLSF